MVRVFASDLLRHRNEDLFSVDLGPETISMRDARPEVRDAVINGNADYLGWLVAGTELDIDLSDPSFHKHAIGQLLEDFPSTHSWVVKGFTTNSKLRLRPSQLSSEGIETGEYSAGSHKIIASKTGWIVELGVLVKSRHLRVVRRNALGSERVNSARGLPSSFAIRG
ncbi:hypothetical protein QPC17_08625 [Trueperella bernardiae]|nr:hypothetical protein [Trueperella bernardiae]WIM07793.1 hypothetical protein QPC17_08625 [Trueperella bernardiae]